MHTISLKLPDNLFDKLEQESRHHGENKSEIIRQALAAYVGLVKTKKRKKLSFLELAEDLCGVLDGPKDLSTNKKYMEDYGE